MEVVVMEMNRNKVIEWERVENEGKVRDDIQDTSSGNCMREKAI